MKRDEIIDKLRVDEHYYGDFGKQYLSNSDISTLLKNPLALKEPSKSNVHFLIGGYFHTAILEPNKIKNFKIVESSSRNTKAYKEMSGSGRACAAGFAGPSPKLEGEANASRHMNIKLHKLHALSFSMPT